MKILETVVYECDFCGKMYQKNASSIFWICCFGKGYNGWGHEFTLCSDECCKKLSQVSKGLLEKLIHNKKPYSEYMKNTKQ